jgi:plasmid stabilization system protein ParE
MNYILSRPASRDIEGIVAYISQSSRQNATRVSTRLDEAFARIARNPEIGSFRPSLTERPLRFVSVYRYLIAYRTDRSPIEIVRVLHGARDIASILRPQ